MAKKVGKVVAEEVGAERQEGKDEETNQMGPDVESLRVHSKRALDALLYRVHLRSVVMVEEFVVPQVPGERVKRDHLPGKLPEFFHRFGQTLERVCVTGRAAHSVALAEFAVSHLPISVFQGHG